MRLTKPSRAPGFERRRLYAQSKVCPPEMRREYRERAEAIGAVAWVYQHQRRRESTAMQNNEQRRVIWRHPQGITNG